MKSLDRKLANIHADPHGAKDFILADAKDADMAAGLAAPGKDARSGKIRSLAEYRDQMREIIRQGLVDIVLMSASTMDMPSSANRFANAKPMPLAEPVTTATLPARSFMGRTSRDECGSG